jgi:hypothetical protein
VIFNGCRWERVGEAVVGISGESRGILPSRILSRQSALLPASSDGTFQVTIYTWSVMCNEYCTCVLVGVRRGFGRVAWDAFRSGRGPVILRVLQAVRFHSYLFHYIPIFLGMTTWFSRIKHCMIWPSSRTTGTHPCMLNARISVTHCSRWSNEP